MKNTQRSYIPGSEWIYFKIYAGDKTMDKLLSNNIYHIISKLKKRQLIEKWFFIRFADPDSHIRVRFLVKETSHIGIIINLIYSQLNKLVFYNLIHWCPVKEI